VGFRPFVFRLAQAHHLTGWVLNADAGVEIHVEGPADALDAFGRDLRGRAPAAATVSDVEVSAASAGDFDAFRILESARRERPTASIAPDLPTCDQCLRELFDESGRRSEHAYISCAHCGPRYSIVTALPYDRARTTMGAWTMCADCGREYHDAADRRFHAQPIACHQCGPRYVLLRNDAVVDRGRAAILEAARLIGDGGIVAVKGLGGYHLACDANDAGAVAALRNRKYRKEKPFAVMAKDVATARTLVHLSPQAEALLVSLARPIVLAPARVDLLHVAPDSHELGVMLPYTPVQHLLFAFGAPAAMVMTSGNRSNDAIAYEDGDAIERLTGIADAFLVGERPIARRVEDSVARSGALGPQILRRSRGYAPGPAARLPLPFPTLAVGADLKNTVTLVVEGDALVSQHIGDLAETSANRAFQETIRDLMTMYDVDADQLVVAHDLHPEYVSTHHATALPARERNAVQHHRAHLASVIAERGDFERRVLGVAFDGTGHGDDGTIWGGEFFVGSVAEGFERVGHLRPAVLPGGDAAARHPVQAAAGFLAQLGQLPDMSAPPFCFPARYRQAQRLIEAGVRVFPTTSAGRLFDTVAALLGFTRESTFEGQAAMWLESLAGRGQPVEGAPLVFRDSELDFRDEIRACIASRLRGRPASEIARAFHFSLAGGIVEAARTLCEAHDVHVVVLAGGVFQNDLLVHDVKTLLRAAPIELWMNRVVPPNDGGISLGQAALMLGRRM
jgi:hydrogenase maturation protein HypF